MAGCPFSIPAEPHRGPGRMSNPLFKLSPSLFPFLREQPFRRLISKGQLLSYAHNGFWACMDTFKELQELEDLNSRGNAPWIVWNGER